MIISLFEAIKDWSSEKCWVASLEGITLRIMKHPTCFICFIISTLLFAVTSSYEKTGTLLLPSLEIRAVTFLSSLQVLIQAVRKASAPYSAMMLAFSSDWMVSVRSLSLEENVGQPLGQSDVREGILGEINDDYAEGFLDAGISCVFAGCPL